jgi:hypothetical protein
MLMKLSGSALLGFFYRRVVEALQMMAMIGLFSNSWAGHKVIQVNGLESCQNLLSMVAHGAVQEESLQIDESAARLFFSTAHRHWDNLFSENYLRQLVTELLAGESLDPRQVSYVEDLKIRGSSLRLAYLLFTSRHEVPQNLQFLVKKLGELKDLSKLPPHGRILAKTQKLQEWIEKDGIIRLRQELQSFQCASTLEIRDYLRATLLGTLEILENNTISAYQFHELKKKLWMLFELIFSLGGPAGPNPEYRKLFKLVNKLMKKIHDPILSLKHGDGHSRREIQVIIPEGLRTKLVEILLAINIR